MKKSRTKNKNKNLSWRARLKVKRSQTFIFKYKGEEIEKTFTSKGNVENKRVVLHKLFKGHIFQVAWFEDEELYPCRMTDIDTETGQAEIEYTKDLGYKKHEESREVIDLKTQKFILPEPSLELISSIFHLQISKSMSVAKVQQIVSSSLNCPLNYLKTKKIKNYIKKEIKMLKKKLNQEKKIKNDLNAVKKNTNNTPNKKTVKEEEEEEKRNFSIVTTAPATATMNLEIKNYHKKLNKKIVDMGGQKDLNSKNKNAEFGTEIISKRILNSPQVQKIKKIQQEKNQIFVESNHDDSSTAVQTKLKKISPSHVVVASDTTRTVVANLKKENKSKINVNNIQKSKIENNLMDDHAKKSCEKKKKLSSKTTTSVVVASEKSSSEKNNDLINVIKKEAKMEQCKNANKTVLVDPEIEILDIPLKKDKEVKKVDKKTKKKDFLNTKKIVTTPVNQRLRPQKPASVQLPLKVPKSRRSISKIVTPTNQSKRTSIGHDSFSNEDKLNTPCHLERIRLWASSLTNSLLTKHEFKITKTTTTTTSSSEEKKQKNNHDDDKNIEKLTITINKEEKEQDELDVVVEKNDTTPTTFINKSQEENDKKEMEIHLNFTKKQKKFIKINNLASSSTNNNILVSSSSSPSLNHINNSSEEKNNYYPSPHTHVSSSFVSNSNVESKSADEDVCIRFGIPTRRKGSLILEEEVKSSESESSKTILEFNSPKKLHNKFTHGIPMKSKSIVGMKRQLENTIERKAKKMCVEEKKFRKPETTPTRIQRIKKKRKILVKQVPSRNTRRKSKYNKNLSPTPFNKLNYQTSPVVNHLGLKSQKNNPSSTTTNNNKSKKLSSAASKRDLTTPTNKKSTKKRSMNSNNTSTKSSKHKTRSILKKTKKPEISGGNSKRLIKFTIPTGGPFGGGKYARMRKLRMKEPRGLTQEEIDVRIEAGKLKRLRNEQKKKQKKPYQSPLSQRLNCPLSPRQAEQITEKRLAKRLQSKRTRANQLEERFADKKRFIKDPLVNLVPKVTKSRGRLILDRLQTL